MGQDTSRLAIDTLRPRGKLLAALSSTCSEVGDLEEVLTKRRRLRGRFDPSSLGANALSIQDVAEILHSKEAATVLMAILSQKQEGANPYDGEATIDEIVFLCTLLLASKGSLANKRRFFVEIFGFLGDRLQIGEIMIVLIVCGKALCCVLEESTMLRFDEDLAEEWSSKVLGVHASIDPWEFTRFLLNFRPGSDFAAMFCEDLNFILCRFHGRDFPLLIFHGKGEAEMFALQTEESTEESFATLSIEGSRRLPWSEFAQSFMAERSSNSLHLKRGNSNISDELILLTPQHVVFKNELTFRFLTEGVEKDSIEDTLGLFDSGCPHSQKGSFESFPLSQGWIENGQILAHFRRLPGIHEKLVWFDEEGERPRYIDFGKTLYARHISELQPCNVSDFILAEIDLENEIHKPGGAVFVVGQVRGKGEAGILDIHFQRRYFDRKCAAVQSMIDFDESDLCFRPNFNFRCKISPDAAFRICSRSPATPSHGEIVIVPSCQMPFFRRGKVFDTRMFEFRYIREETVMARSQSFTLGEILTAKDWTATATEEVGFTCLETERERISWKLDAGSSWTFFSRVEIRSKNEVIQWKYVRKRLSMGAFENLCVGNFELWFVGFDGFEKKLKDICIDPLEEEPEDAEEDPQDRLRFAISKFQARFRGKRTRVTTERILKQARMVNHVLKVKMKSALEDLERARRINSKRGRLVNSDDLSNEKRALAVFEAAEAKFVNSFARISVSRFHEENLKIKNLRNSLFERKMMNEAEIEQLKAFESLEIRRLQRDLVEKPFQVDSERLRHVRAKEIAISSSKFCDWGFPPGLESLCFIKNHSKLTTCLQKVEDWPRFSIDVPEHFDAGKIGLLNRFLPKEAMHLLESFEVALQAFARICAKRDLPKILNLDDIGNGVIGVRLFIDREWQEIVIDNRFPVLCTETLLSVVQSGHSWILAIEKAIAKAFKNYEAAFFAEKRTPEDYFQLMTGCVISLRNVNPSQILESPYCNKWTNDVLTLDMQPLQTFESVDNCNDSFPRVCFASTAAGVHVEILEVDRNKSAICVRRVENLQTLVSRRRRSFWEEEIDLFDDGTFSDGSVCMSLENFASCFVSWSKCVLVDPNQDSQHLVQIWFKASPRFTIGGPFSMQNPTLEIDCGDNSNLVFVELHNVLEQPELWLVQSSETTEKRMASCTGRIQSLLLYGNRWQTIQFQTWAPGIETSCFARIVMLNSKQSHVLYWKRWGLTKTKDRVSVMDLNCSSDACHFCNRQVSNGQTLKGGLRVCLDCTMICDFCRSSSPSAIVATKGGGKMKFICESCFSSQFAVKCMNCAENRLQLVLAPTETPETEDSIHLAENEVPVSDPVIALDGTCSSCNYRL